MERGPHDGCCGMRYAQAPTPGGAAGSGPSGMSSSMHGARAPSPARLGKGPAAVDPRNASFVRLNTFLLRTHITSLISALAEDGWLESWEKERLCRQARDDSGTWTLVFLRSYTRFMEKDDVQGFVESLRNQIPAS